jgi:hypothetical protein
LRSSDERLTMAVNQAHRQARKLRIMLRSVDFGLDVPVSPLVVVWGDHDWTAGEYPDFDGCTVVAGNDVAHWLEGWSQNLDVAVASTGFTRATTELRRYQERRDRYDEATGDLPLIVRSGLAQFGPAMTEAAVAFFVGLVGTVALVKLASEGIDDWALSLLLTPTIAGGLLCRRRPFAGWSLIASGGLLLALAGVSLLAALF